MTSVPPDGAAGATPDEVMSPRGPDGASPQRTRLAWRRTALSQTVGVLLLLKLAAGSRYPVAGAVLGAAGMLVWIAGIWLIQHRITAMASRVPAAAGRTLPGFAVITSSYALLGVVLLVLG
jgi:hypothetical protein